MCLAIIFVYGCASDESSSGVVIEDSAAAMEDVAEDDVEDSDSAAMEDAIEMETIVITGENYKFMVDGVENPDISVKVGQKVRIEFSSTQGFHDWVVSEFDAATSQIAEGDSSFVEFIADKAGDYKYFCSVGNHRAQGMEGNFIVE